MSGNRADDHLYIPEPLGDQIIFFERSAIIAIFFFFLESSVKEGQCVDNVNHPGVKKNLGTCVIIIKLGILCVVIHCNEHQDVRIREARNFFFFTFLQLFSPSGSVIIPKRFPADSTGCRC